MLDEGSGVIFSQGLTPPRMKGDSTMEVKSRAKVGSLARLAMAKEKARIMGKKPTVISELEKAAEQWQRQKELEQRGFPGTKQRSASR